MRFNFEKAIFICFLLSMGTVLLILLGIAVTVLSQGAPWWVFVAAGGVFVPGIGMLIFSIAQVATE